MPHYDVIVIGAGPAGGAAASACRAAGLRVLLADQDGFGGTCPLRGCNPKKVLVGVAHAQANAAHLQGVGLGEPPALDWGALARFRDSFVEGRPASIEAAYRDEDIDTVHGQARFTGPNCMTIGEESYDFARAVIACGMRPRTLMFPGVELVIDSAEFLKLMELPRRIVFAGGGYISFEFAHVAVRAGAACTILHRSRQPLKGFDPEMVEVLVEVTREAGIAVELECEVESVMKQGDGLLVRAGGRELACDMVVHGAGRVPQLDGLDLEAAHVEADGKGVQVNSYMQSVSNPKVYAAGDCAATPYALTPSGSYEGKVAAQNIIRGECMEVDHTGIPRVVFSIPPLAAVGLDEDQASKQGRAVQVIRRDLGEWFPWKHRKAGRGAAKVLLDPETDAVLGFHAVGEDVDELANIFAAAVRLKLTARQLKDVVWVYPTSGYYTQYLVKEPGE